MARKTKNFSDTIKKKLAANPDLAKAVEAERANANIGSEILAARVAAGLSQAQLAKRIGTRQSAIARLESADYDGHSVQILNRIAAALGKRLEVRFTPSSG